MVANNMVAGKVARIRMRGLSLRQDVYLCRHRFRPFGSQLSTFWEFFSLVDSTIAQENQVLGESAPR